MKTYRVLGQKVVRTVVEIIVKGLNLDDVYEQAEDLGIEVDRVDALDDLEKTIQEKLRDN